MGFPVLASCKKKVPEPKHRAIARCEVCVSIYITYISVSKSTPLAVTGPHGQLASKLIVSQRLATACREQDLKNVYVPSVFRPSVSCPPPQSKKKVGSKLSNYIYIGNVLKSKFISNLINL